MAIEVKPAEARYIGLAKEVVVGAIGLLPFPGAGLIAKGYDKLFSEMFTTDGHLKAELEKLITARLEANNVANWKSHSEARLKMLHEASKRYLASAKNMDWSSEKRKEELRLDLAFAEDKARAALTMASHRYAYAALPFYVQAVHMYAFLLRDKVAFGIQMGYSPHAVDGARQELAKLKPSTELVAGATVTGKFYAHVEAAYREGLEKAAAWGWREKFEYHRTTYLEAYEYLMFWGALSNPDVAPPKTFVRPDVEVFSGPWGRGENLQGSFLESTYRKLPHRPTFGRVEQIEMTGPKWAYGPPKPMGRFGRMPPSTFKVTSVRCKMVDGYQPLTGNGGSPTSSLKLDKDEYFEVVGVRHDPASWVEALTFTTNKQKRLGDVLTGMSHFSIPGWEVSSVHGFTGQTGDVKTNAFVVGFRPTPREYAVPRPSA
jgi:hypothetical protein